MVLHFQPQVAIQFGEIACHAAINGFIILRKGIGRKSATNSALHSFKEQKHSLVIVRMFLHYHQETPIIHSLLT